MQPQSQSEECASCAQAASRGQIPSAAGGANLSANTTPLAEEHTLEQAAPAAGEVAHTTLDPIPLARSQSERKAGSQGL